MENVPLSVSLRTDYDPSREFFEIEVALIGTGKSERVNADDKISYATASRVLTTFEDLPPDPARVVEVKLVGHSGHVAGVVNPPVKNKYGYWTNNDLAASPQGWLDSAEQHEGSWWPDWAAWLAKQSGEQVPARTPGDGKLEVIEDAPGSYVTVDLRQD